MAVEAVEAIEAVEATKAVEKSIKLTDPLKPYSL